MKIFIHKMFLFVLVILFSCNGNHHNHETEENSNHRHAIITLDNGKKWQVDESTRTHVKIMEEAVRNISSSAPQANMEMYTTLAGVLKENIAKLTSGCTMTGESHRQLHNWLEVYIEKTRNLSASATPQDATKSLDELRNCFDDYHRNFE